MLGQERSPVVINEGRICLHRVEQTNMRGLQCVGEIHCAFKPRLAEQRWLATLPGDRDFVSCGDFKELGQIRLKYRKVHSKHRIGIQVCFVEEEAVGAVKVADRS